MFVLALDQGTTSSRALLFDHSGNIRAIAQHEFPQHFPQPGWVEHDPIDIWNSQRDVALEVLAKAKVPPSEIAAVGLTNQRETTILWDRKTGEPVHRAIVWQDRRTAALCAEIRESRDDDFFRRKTGLVVDPYFSATKIRWLLDQIPGLRTRAEKGEIAFGTVDSWLVWKLTGGRAHLTDATNASRTLLFNLETGDWDDELLALFQIPRAMLPEIRSSSETVAEISDPPELAGIPIAGIAGDQHAALFGQACCAPGLAKNTYGTGSFVLMNTGEKPVFSQNGLVTTVAWKIGPKIEYALEGSIFVSGALIQWLRDSLGIIQSAAEIESLAARVSDTGGVTIVPAFSGLGAPHWDPHARGAIFGLTRGTTPAHLARAALEAIAWQAVDVLSAMASDAQIPLAELRVDGGASADNLLMQLQSDFLQAPVSRPRITETTALGAAFLAGLATGFWKDQNEIASYWTLDRRFEPQQSPTQIAPSRTRWLAAIPRTKSWP